MARALGIAVALLLTASPLAAQPSQRDAEIGSWELRCPAGRHSACTLRLRSWLLPPGDSRPSVAVEVQRRGDTLVPVVAVRGLPPRVALAGVTAMQPAVSLRFDGGPRIALACTLDGGAIVCAPQGPAAGAAAAALPGAHVLLVRVALSIPGLAGLPEQDRTLDLAGTPQALARYRAAGASGEALPAEPGLDWQGFLDRVLHAAGFAHGMADLLPALSSR